jgi:hypothetical protein
MRRRTSLSRAALCALGVASLTRGATAEPPSIRAELSCRPEPAPGRVLCELAYRASAGVRIVWADALVTEAPAFAPPLRARVSPVRFAQAGSSERKLSLAFVASQVGAGTASVRARAVGCSGQAAEERCRVHTQLVRAELRVGG